MKAEILAIGSELTHGEKLDTNSQWLSRRLGNLGIEVRFHTTLGDDLEDNVAALRLATGRAELVLTGGGLGPTQDDLTREALARVAGVPLEEDPGSLRAIQALFARRNREMPERNRIQALRPVGAEALANRVGTAPGIWMPVGPSVVACLPGVPYELFAMFDEQVVPRLRQMGAVRTVIVRRVINLFGKGESDIEQLAMDLTARGRLPEVGITASDATISFRISAEGATEAEAHAATEATARVIYERFGELIVGEEDQDVAGGLAAELARTGLTLATAESCTGGLIARRLTAIPGISAWFPGGFVTYSEQAKVDLIGVPRPLIDTEGVVSAAVAEAMADGCRRRLGADLGIGVTGFAGPDGESVGLVYVGLASAQGTRSRRLDLGPEQPRWVIQSRAAKHAMNQARLYLRELPAQGR